MDLPEIHYAKRARVFFNESTASKVHRDDIASRERETHFRNRSVLERVAEIFKNVDIRRLFSLLVCLYMTE